MAILDSVVLGSRNHQEGKFWKCGPVGAGGCLFWNHCGSESDVQAHFSLQFLQCPALCLGRDWGGGRRDPLSASALRMLVARKQAADDEQGSTAEARCGPPVVFSASVIRFLTALRSKQNLHSMSLSRWVGLVPG